MSLRERVDELNRMILQGKILEAFEQFYADDVVMQENDEEPRVGKAVNRAYEEAFVNGLTEFRGARLENVAVDEEKGVAFCEWFFDYTHKDFGSRTYHQVARQIWKDGKIVNERFYHA
ncbi:MAG: nuclear transport factor 2 family protein [Bacteroidetes bacterium]|nr:MAG: nuclear transport factor 2 family protein [Bacteroidota bacterium]